MKDLMLKSVSFLCFTALFAASALAADVTTLEIGEPAPDFTLPGVDGKTYSLDDFSDADILAIIFTCNHCPTAQSYEERIKQLTADYKDKGVAVVAISPNDPKAVRLDELGYTTLNDTLEEMKLRAEYKEFNFPYLYDGDKQEASKQYGPNATPHAFVFGPDRTLQYTGAIDDADNPENVDETFLRDVFDAMLAGNEVPVRKTKTFGCSIKWSDKQDTVERANKRFAQEEVTLQEVTKEELAEIMKNDSDKLWLVNVWATWCAPCVEEFPELIEIYRMYRGRQFDMVTISANQLKLKEYAYDFLQDQNASSTNYIYAGGKGIELMNTVDPKSPGALPHTVLVKPGGEIVYRHDGQIDPLEVKREIIKILGNTYHSPGLEE